MKTDLFELDPAAIRSAAALLANRLVAVAKPRTPEQTLRIAFQGAVDEIARRLKFNLNWRDEYRMIEGRADTVYGGLVIEYEPPCSLRQSNRSGANPHAIQQVKDYISGLQRRERHDIERYAGVVCDGVFFIFLRYKEGHWHTEPPVPVTPYYRGREGSNTGGLNGALWVQITSVRPDGKMVISNLHDTGKIKVKSVTATVEPDLVFPLLRGRDVGRWKARPEYSILVPQDPEQPSRGFPVNKLQATLPKTYDFLLTFEEQLRKRSGFRQFFNPELDPFYSIYNVGPYTFAPFKVVWREVSCDIRAGVAEPPKDGEKVIVPDHTLISVACESHEEAHFVCALLNSSPANFIVRGYVALHPSPHIMNYIHIPKFNPKDKLHVRLAESSAACHATVGSVSDEEMAALEAANDELAAQLWNLSAAELKDIKNSLADLC